MSNTDSPRVSTAIQPNEADIEKDSNFWTGMNVFMTLFLAVAVLVLIVVNRSIGPLQIIAVTLVAGLKTVAHIEYNEFALRRNNFRLARLIRSGDTPESPPSP